jgi:hypothetical protein
MPVAFSSSPGSVFSSTGDAGDEIFEMIWTKLPVKSRYICGKEFDLRAFEEEIDADAGGELDNFHLLYVDGEMFNLWHVQQGRPTLASRSNALINNKQRNGGQSAQRFGRIREGQQLSYARRVAEELDDLSLIAKKRVVFAGSREWFGRVEAETVVKPLVRFQTVDSAIERLLPSVLVQLDGAVSADAIVALSLFRDLLGRASERLLFGDSVYTTPCQTLLVSKYQWAKLDRVKQAQLKGNVNNGGGVHVIGDADLDSFGIVGILWEGCDAGAVLEL